MTEENTLDDVQGFTLNFQSFYSHSWGVVFRAVAVAVGEADLAREAVDEAMTRAYERWGSVSRMKNPEGWVYRVAVNWSRSLLRRRLVRSTKRPTLNWVIEDAEVPDPAVVNAVRNLPPHQRDVIVARFLLDMSEKETAHAFGIASGTVKSRVSRALSTLREELS
jgi:RNA polymerase sigma-70 factor (ECF subfamily)